MTNNAHHHHHLHNAARNPSLRNFFPVSDGLAEFVDSRCADCGAARILIPGEGASVLLAFDCEACDAWLREVAIA